MPGGDRRPWEDMSTYVYVQVRTYACMYSLPELALDRFKVSGLKVSSLMCYVHVHAATVTWNWNSMEITESVTRFSMSLRQGMCHLSLHKKKVKTLGRCSLLVNECVHTCRNAAKLSCSKFSPHGDYICMYIAFSDLASCMHLHADQTCTRIRVCMFLVQQVKV